ncbi:hypothetical protein COO60DRAFT_641940 [Scenedesmus sp. NREL 46B-D3]|nr:hypothetical protein COO60DRAFT_641940 [Scenedesmus sp. NREL 46B-D3]
MGNMMMMMSVSLAPWLAVRCSVLTNIVKNTRGGCPVTAVPARSCTGRHTRNICRRAVLHLALCSKELGHDGTKMAETPHAGKHRLLPSTR